MLEGLKVVTAQEMARIEKWALMQGADQEIWIDAAGRAIADIVDAFVKERQLDKKITLLIGKGNKGSDALATGICLLEKRYQVKAILLFSKNSPLNEKKQREFIAKKGVITDQIEWDGLIVDGIFGTGFQGAIEPRITSIIRSANNAQQPIIAIDIPSGVNGDTGHVEGGAIVAQETATLGLPKFGLFIRDGWNHTGKLHIVDFGLPQDAVEQASAIAFVPKQVHLPKIVRNRHKYQAGYVAGLGSAKEYPMAAQLSAYAALKTGAGIARLFHLDLLEPLLYPELIYTKWQAKPWKEALSKANAVFIGPGLGKTARVQKWLKTHVPAIKQHCVIDADAIGPQIKYPKNAVLTPHRGEALRLLGMSAMPSEEELFAAIMRLCEKKHVYVVLKGAPTFIFAPERMPVIIPHGDPGMATAGSGDVLTGMIAAMLAQGMSALEGAVTAATLHAFAGELAAEQLTSYCMTATDILHFLPQAFKYIA